ncbi:MAG: response regulator [Methylococcaceae bacterium]|nr:MAG: response regulator [Methylococcaceae bacterium]
MTRTILIVDDSITLRQVVAIALSDAGYQVVEAGDGKEGLTKLDAHKVQLIISDVNMPVMDGIAFLKAIKQRPDYKFTPVIILTTENAQAKMQEGQAAGARAWVVKPFQPAQMLSAVAKLIQA